jgi:chromosome segregation ATPase
MKNLKIQGKFFFFPSLKATNLIVNLINIRRTHMRALESMQASLETESKGKSEAIRNKKKLESDINDLEARVNHANVINLDLHRENKKLQQNLNDLYVQIDDEQKQKNDAKDLATQMDRRAISIQNELEEFRSMLDQVERARKSTEASLNESNDRINELTLINANLNNQKRKLENDLMTIQGELNDNLNESKNSEERIRKASGDVFRITDELRKEQVYFLLILSFIKLLLKF